MKLRSLLRSPSGPIRRRLLRDLVLLVLVTVGLVVAVNAMLIGELKEDLATARIDSAIGLVRDEVRNRLSPVPPQLLILGDALRGQPTDDVATLNRLLMPTLRHMDQIAGAIYAADDGSEYFLRRDGDLWLTRLRPAGDDDQVAITHWSKAGRALDTSQRQLAYDPRERPWYQAATELLDTGDERTFVWSQPYRFHSLATPGVTVATAWREGATLRVAALDVTLESIVAAIDRLPLGPEGQGFLLDAAGGVYDGHAPTGGDGEDFYSAESHHGGPLPFEAVAAWRTAGQPADTLVPFESGRRAWWASFLPLSEQTRSGWVGVAVPVSVTLGVLQSRWHLVALTALAIVALGIGLAALVVRRYSRQLRDLPKLGIDRTDPERDIYDLIGRGEGTHLELKSTMRTNLHTGKPGKEIELAWLKGVAAFLNTEGGILLLGVADDGTVLGLTADAFANDDKCQLHFKNLINQHLGPELARFVQFSLFGLEGGQVGVVECERADTPVFLRHPKGESFLIRNGPSNIELPISRALTYIRGRF
ncbi:putative transcriptional regulator with HTH domain [Thioflavicoccus mobilis 8321]|uniref:Putative transcriptional regulator with HTH domain n=1 Tax=Thioflavicoccus mobilis 8321 TaxID=765912 RepID=L0H3A1_9GAMM|nr:RNA-binding domain-containing protein [Thioflavicoccus mobilis]AGA92140.1 putative transcriptional regulator with HTH domain [Thioflavicoccus mobilis 8321]